MNDIPLQIQAKIKFARDGQLKELDLSYRSTSVKLQEIPSQVFELTHLEVLNLRENEISEIPKEILYLTNLKTLNLIDNQLKEIPDYLAKLPHLKSICLSYKH